MEGIREPSSDHKGKGMQRCLSRDWQWLTGDREGVMSVYKGKSGGGEALLVNSIFTIR